MLMNISIAKAIVAAVCVTLVTTAATAFGAGATASPRLQGSLPFQLRDAKGNGVGGAVITLEADWLDVNLARRRQRGRQARDDPPARRAQGQSVRRQRQPRRPRGLRLRPAAEP
jgi:hypothetical protein